MCDRCVEHLIDLSDMEYRISLRIQENLLRKGDLVEAAIDSIKLETVSMIRRGFDLD